MYMASKVDPNIYSLSIQLQLEAKDAFTSLDSFGQQIGDLEKQVSSSAQKSLQSISQMAKETEKAISDIAKVFKKVDATTVKVNDNLTDAGKELKDQFDTDEDSFDILEDRLDNLRRILKIQETMGKLQAKELASAVRIGNAIDAVLASNEATVRTQRGELGNLGRMQQSMDGINAAVLRKNRGHERQNDLLATDVALADRLGISMDNVGDGMDRANKPLTRLLSTARYLWGIVRAIDADTERFVTTNYRAYGSQQQLVQGARNLAMATGVTYENAVEAFQVLGNLKVPRDELEKYASIVTIANRVTGVGIGTTAEYVNRLRVAGLGLAGAERSLAHMAEAMRRYGLNTRDVNALMNQTIANTQMAARVFGGNAAVTIDAWNKQRTALAGFARQMGYGAEELDSFNNAMLNDIAAMAIFKSFTGTTERGIDGFSLAMMRAGIKAEEMMAQLEAANDGSEMAANALRAQQESLIQTYFQGNRAAFEAARAQGRLAIANGLTGDSIDEVNQLLDIQANTQANQLGEANNTLTRQLTLLASKIWAMVGTIGQLIADAILPFVRALNWLLSGLGSIIGYIDWFITKLEQIPILGRVVSFIKWVAGAVLGLGLVFILASGAIAAFAAMFAGVSGLIAGAARVVVSLMHMIVVVAQTFGQVIVIILSSIGRGLAMLGSSVAPVILPIMALGVALLLVGAASWLFAQAVAIIAQQGWAAVPAILGLVAAIFVLGLTLIFLGGLAMAVMPGMIVLGLTLLLVGAAATLLGFGLYLAGMGLQMMAGVLTVGLVINLALLGVALVALGAAAMFVAPGLLVLGVAMILAGAASILFGFGLQLIARAMQLLDPSHVLTVASAFLGAATMLAASAILIGIAGAIFVVAGPALIVGAMMLLLAALALLPGGAVLLISSLLLLVGGSVLIVASVLIAASGLALLVGGLSMLLGAGMLIVAVALLSGVGIAMLFAATLLGIGAMVMLPAAASMVVAGGLISLGGLTLLVGSTTLTAAATTLMVGATLVLASGLMLFAGAALLLAAGAVLMAATALLLLASGTFIVAGFALVTGVAMLLPASAMLLTASYALLFALPAYMAAVSTIFAGAELLMAGATVLAQASAMLMLSAVLLPVAGQLITDAMGTLAAAGAMAAMVGGVLMTSSVVLMGAAGWMLMAAGTLAMAGAFLIPASFAIFSGMLWLQFAIERFSKTADKVERIGRAVQVLANAFVLLERTPLHALKDVATASLQAIPDIEALGPALSRAASGLDKGVNDFTGPADRLAEVLDNLGNSIASFGQSITLGDDLGQMAQMLEEYAALLESASERIEVAVQSRAIPAMRAAEEAGIEQTVLSEAISTVQVMDNTEGQSGENQGRMLEYLARIAEGIDSLEERVAAMEPGAGSEVGQILELLSAYLPNMQKGDSGLGNELNSWGK
jgi:hypothetical protein